ncbi:rhodanese-like domain-containing protein [Streptacidiphilus sp. N1-10]|uniref:Rhodanese-like domain-containing protein n=1 Tax=Streptacidiphilus jeojiensis TaxID=3229225 RepID=A0ABV6XWK7_9ACTN
MDASLPGPLVDAAWLAAHLGDPDLVVLDATALLPSPRYDGDYQVGSGRPQWLERHIPGSQHADLTADLSDHAAPYHFAMPSPEALAAALRPLGVGDGTAVVAYDSGGGIWAARLWWMLRSLSVPAAVLDGGWEGWTAAGHPTASGEPAPAPDRGPLTPRPRPELWAGIDDFAAVSSGERPGTLVCALPTPAFEGTAPTRYTRRGHIPDSRSLPGRGLLDDSGHFLPPARLAALVDPVLDAAGSRTVLYCGGGIAAAGAALALTLLGHDDVSIYDGSLEQWSADPARPLALGAADPH